MEQKFKSRVSNLKRLGNRRFSIPSYQRPYIWKEEQIKKLLDDFWDAYARGDSHYYIGTVLTSEQKESDELIDGQQRFTTLWLIAVSFKILKIDSLLLNYLTCGDELRFDFAIRKQLKAYLSSLLGRSRNDKNLYSDSEIEGDEYLIHVARAVTTISRKVDTMPFTSELSRENFGNYIFENIQFVVNTAPEGTNLNTLFSTVNNSGVQLEQADILKAKLLSLIGNANASTENRVLYSRIWEACENLSDYFERNVKQLFEATNWAIVNKETFKEFDPNIFKYRYADHESASDVGIVGFDLADLLIEDQPSGVVLAVANKTIQSPQTTDFEKINCRSIINFPQLLLHTIRIYLHQQQRPDFQRPFHSKYLLDIFQSFKNEDEGFVTGFFHCLWKVRNAFDVYVVKWVEKMEDREEELKVASLSISDGSFTRTVPENGNAITMLQSVMYFTGNYNTQIWLSPFLKRMIDGEDPLNCLEDIDNTLSLSSEEDKQTSFQLLNGKIALTRAIELKKYLEEPKGTKFKHYWFQKLEYVLWKNWDDKNDKQYKEYRITSRNSVEHVYPQHPEYGGTLEDKYLHSFGNLGLLSVSQNSSYSRQYVTKKKTDFVHKLSYDSLKLKYLYDGVREGMSEQETINQIELHKEDMVNRILKHYSHQ